MADPDRLTVKERVKITIRYSCTTNGVNDPNYFDDYYEDKWIYRNKKRGEQ